MSKHETIKSAMMGEAFKKEMTKRHINITMLGEKINMHQPSLSRVLSGKVRGTDELFERIGKGIGLTDRRLKQIFQEVDRELFIYKYGQDILNQRDFSYEELFKIMQEKEHFSEKQINAIEEFINFQKGK